MIIFFYFLLTNVALVRGVDDQGVFPREMSFFDPLLVQVEKRPGRRVESSRVESSRVYGRVESGLFGGACHIDLDLATCTGTSTCRL